MSNDPSSPTHGPGDSPGNFVLLRAGALRLLLPQEDVGAAEYIGQAPLALGEAGFFSHTGEEGERVVVAPSEHLRPLETFPEDRYLLTRLGESELMFAWNEVQVLIDARFVMHRLPAAMQVEGAPVDGYVTLDGDLALCTDAARVVAYTTAHRG